MNHSGCCCCCCCCWISNHRAKPYQFHGQWWRLALNWAEGNDRQSLASLDIYSRPTISIPNPSSESISIPFNSIQLMSSKLYSFSSLLSLLSSSHSTNQQYRVNYTHYYHSFYSKDDNVIVGFHIKLPKILAMESNPRSTSGIVPE